MEKERILILIDNYQIGGAETQALHLARGLKHNYNYDITFLALYKFSNEPLKQKLINEEINFQYFDSLYLRFSRLRKFLVLIDALRFLKYKNYILLSYTIRPNLFCGLMWKLGIGKKLIWNQEDIGIGFPGPDNGMLFKGILNTASIIISNSQVAANHLLSFYPVIEKKIHVIKNGIQCTEDENIHGESKELIRKKLGLSPNKTLIVKVANITSFKDHKTVIEAANLLKENLVENSWQIIFIGHLGNTFNELAKYVKDRDLEQYILFVGFKENVSEYLKAADFAVFSSLSEGIPNGILEPMANSIPVIASRIPGNVEALGNTYPYYFEIGDAFNLSNLISFFITNKVCRNEVGQLCYKRVIQNFSLKDMINQTAELIKG